MGALEPVDATAPTRRFCVLLGRESVKAASALDEMCASFRPDSKDVLSYLFKDTLSNRHLTLTATLTHTSFNFSLVL